jgi:hypothetical protein
MQQSLIRVLHGTSSEPNRFKHTIITDRVTVRRLFPESTYHIVDMGHWRNRCCFLLLAMTD